MEKKTPPLLATTDLRTSATASHWPPQTRDTFHWLIEKAAAHRKFVDENNRRVARNFSCHATRSGLTASPVARVYFFGWDHDDDDAPPLLLPPFEEELAWCTSGGIFQIVVVVAPAPDLPVHSLEEDLLVVHCVEEQLPRPAPPPPPLARRQSQQILGEFDALYLDGSSDEAGATAGAAISPRLAGVSTVSAVDSAAAGSASVVSAAAEAESSTMITRRPGSPWTPCCFASACSSQRELLEVGNVVGHVHLLEVWLNLLLASQPAEPCQPQSVPPVSAQCFFAPTENPRAR